LSVDNSSQRFIAIGLDADYAQSQRVFVASVETTTRGERTLTVARYREVGGQLGERAVLVSALPIPASAEPLVRFDSANQIYVAVPREEGGRASGPYDGELLRLSSEGTIPWASGQRSPVLADGVDHPDSLLPRVASGSIWLAGSNASNGSALRVIPLHDLAAPALIVSSARVLALTVSADAPSRLSALDDLGRIIRFHLRPDSDAVVGTDVPAFDAGGRAVSLAAAARDTFYVTVEASEDGRQLTRLVRLRPAKSAPVQSNP
jgi:hypothetical protein